MSNIKHKIIEKTCGLFKKYGIKSVSMDEIAKACGISKKTLYEHISDKSELVKAVINSEFQKDEPQNVDYNTAKTAIDQLFLGYLAMIEFFKNFNLSFEHDLQKYYPDLYIKATKKRRAKIYDRLVENIKKGIEEGVYRKDFNIDLIAKIHVIKIEGILTTDIFDNDDYTITDIFKEMFIHHFMGVATTKGIEDFYKKMKEIETNKEH